VALGRGGGQKTRTCTTGRSARFAADGWAPRRSCPGRAVLGFTARELGHGAIRPRWTDGSCCCDMPEASVSCGRAACSSSAPPNGSQHHRGEVLSGLGVTGSPPCRFHDQAECPISQFQGPEADRLLTANCRHCHPDLRGGVRSCHRGWCANVAVSKPSGCCAYCRRGESASVIAPSARVGLLDGVSRIQCRSVDKCRCCYTDRHSCWFSARCLEGDTRCLNLDEGGARYRHRHWRERQFVAELPEIAAASGDRCPTCHGSWITDASVDKEQTRLGCACTRGCRSPHGPCFGGAQWQWAR
jgi:hypothetical protein